MKTKIGLLIVVCMLLSSISVFGADYDCTVTYIPDNSDAEVYMIGDYYYIGDDTIMKKDGAIITSGKYKFDFNSWQAECFENGYIKVQDKTTGLMGLMSENGEIVTEVKYSDIEVFDEKGEAIAVIQGEKHGVIDKEGNVVIPFDFDYIRRCNHDELFVAGKYKYFDDTDADFVREMYYGLIDRKGNVILPIEYEDIDSFDRYGFIKTSYKRGWKQGLANDKGKVILEIKYRDIYIYNEGEYILAIDDNGLKYYWFDKEGNNIFPEHDRVGIASQTGVELLIPVKDNKEGLAEYDGTIIFESIYDNVEPTAKDGLIMLEKDGKTQWANAEGEIIKDAYYEDCYSTYYNESGLYALKQNGLWAIAFGEEAVGEFKYTEIDYFPSVNNVIMGTKEDGTMDAIDELTGEVIYENVISSYFNYSTDYYYIKDNQAYQINYDRTLTPAWPDKYIYVGRFKDNVAVARNMENLWGLINEKGEPITEFKYESFKVCVGVNHGDAVYDEYIYYIDDDLVMVMLDGKIGYVNLKGEMVIEPKFGYNGMWYSFGKFNMGYAEQYLINGGECYIDREGNVYEQGRIRVDAYPTVSSSDYKYTVLYKDDEIEIWNKNTNERIMFSVGNTLYKEDGSFLVDTILKNDNGSLKVRYEYDEGFSVWTEFGRFIIDVTEK
ncbi:MAG: WG repeat-containing protein [Clostridia bacterium]|nr:WG repeat-containing protein [Clostridia bacterium]